MLLVAPQGFISIDNKMDSHVFHNGTRINTPINNGIHTPIPPHFSAPLESNGYGSSSFDYCE